MKILIGFLLALFISGQAYAQSSTEVIDKGKIISSHTHENQLVSLLVMYKKELYKCDVSYKYATCYKPRNMDVEIP
tara:strand:+ start:3313 stop:3540 length:228 start_codon:yes stop_codon:yes gene_type:complete